MKKKLRKELNKLLSDGLEAEKYLSKGMEVEKAYNLQKIAENEETGLTKFSLSFFARPSIKNPVKEEPLMLGEFEVNIEVKINEFPKLDIVLIKCGGIVITKDEWMEWQQVFVPAFKAGAYIDIYLCGFTTEIRLSDGNFIRISSINFITIDQIEAITQKLKEYE